MGSGERSRMGKRPTIALLIDVILGLGGYQSALWRGVSRAAREHDVNLICLMGGSLRVSPTNQYEYQRNVIYELVSKESVDGVLINASVLGRGVGWQEFAEFCRSFHPLPTLSAGFLVEGVTSLIVDGMAGLRREVEHLVKDHGRRRIAFIRGPEANKDAETRYQAYTETLGANGIEFDPDLVVPGDFIFHTGAKAVSVLIDERMVEFDALVAANDVMAIGAMQELESRGLHVPENAAIAGFDDVADARVSLPPLTTVRQPIEEMGERAVEVMISMLAGEETALEETLPTELVVRQSCGCPPRAPIEVSVVAHTSEQRGRAGAAKPVKSQISEIFGGSGVQDTAFSREAPKLLRAFQDDLEGRGPPERFLAALDRTARQDAALRQALARGVDIGPWNRAVSVLRDHTLGLPTDVDRARRAAVIWLLASAHFDDLAISADAYRRIEEEHEAAPRNAAAQVLLTSFDLASLMDEAAEHLPAMGIESCYISLYENPGLPGDGAKLMLAYNNSGRRQLGPAGLRYDARLLLPKDILRGHGRFDLCINSLYFRESCFGFVAFGMEEPRHELYETLATQISTALQGGRVVKELRETEEELARSNTELEQFAYVASHDLQEPLRMISSYLQLLERRYKGQLDDDADEFIDFAVDGASRMQTLINDLLTYSRVGTRGKPFEPTDTGKVLELALLNLRVAVEENGAKITHDDMPTLSVDATQMTQLLQNLIGNAIKFHKKDTLPEVHIGAERKNSSWILSVRDNGIGIDPSDFERIFMIFQRLHTRDEYDGTGIGLAVCRKIVERHGGRIWVESEPGQGSTFSFSLPDRED
jgi:signal transduction histidine kinase/DNA-binding LacI/PurR family transcriptional regulator